MAGSRRKLAILAFSPIQRDARVLRQIACLARDHDVVVIGYGELGAAAALPGVRMRALRSPGRALHRSALVLATTALGRIVPDVGYRAWASVKPEHRAARAALVAERAEVIVANDWEALPVALRALRDAPAKLVVDLHEFAPLHWENRLPWMTFIAPLIDYHLKHATPSVAAAMTVNQTIADEYQRRYGLRCAVVRNIPSSTTAPDFRATDPERVRLIHHGNATRDRKLELMIETVARTDRRFSLHFMLVPLHRGYVDELRELGDRVAPGRVFFEPPVAPGEIVQAISRFDVGIFILPPVTFNYRAALPNKFFEFIFAGLAVCTGPSPEMARIAREHELGLVTETFDPAEVALRLNALDAPQIDRMKRSSLAARAELTPDREMETLRQLVAGAIGA